MRPVAEPVLELVGLDFDRVIGDESQIETAKRFATRENADNAGQDRPQLVINYTPTGGPTGPSVLEEEIWGCRTCGACQTECPVHIEHIPKIIDMRRNLVMTESRMGEETQQVLKNIEDRMHPWVGTPHDREAWFADLDIKVLGRGAEAPSPRTRACAPRAAERVRRRNIVVLNA